MPKKMAMILVGPVIALALFAYGLHIVLAKTHALGTNPRSGVLGQVKQIDQRAMTQSCTGTYSSPEGTWLLGTREGEGIPEEFRKLDLTRLSPSPLSSPFAGYSLISRLDRQSGEFEVVASVPSDGCLIQVPHSRRLLFLSRLSYANQKSYARSQVLFRSDDLGATWEISKEGFFSESALFALIPNVFFFDQQTAWQWDSPQNPSTPGEPSLWEVARVSMDQGAHSQVVSVPLADLTTLDSLLASQPVPGAQWQNERLGETKTWVRQWDPDHALIWVSQSFGYTLPPNAKYITGYHRMTHQFEFERDPKNGSWSLQHSQILPDLELEAVSGQTSSETVAVTRQTGSQRARLMKWDAQQKKWDARSELPNPLGFLSSWTGLRNLWSAGNLIVVSTMAHHEVPRALFPWREASVSADGVYMTTDFGSHWTKLRIEGYLGVLGVDSGKIHWADGNWYNSSDLAVNYFQVPPLGADRQGSASMTSQGLESGER